MSRTAIAVPLGLLGFLAYLLAVLALADIVLGWSLWVQVPFFLAAGTLWALPVHHLMLWVGRKA